MLVSSWWQNDVLCTKRGREFWRGAVSACWMGAGRRVLHLSELNALPLLRVQCAQWEPACDATRACQMRSCGKNKNKESALSFLRSRSQPGAWKDCGAMPRFTCKELGTPERQVETADVLTEEHARGTLGNAQVRG